MRTLLCLLALGYLASSASAAPLILDYAPWEQRSKQPFATTQRIVTHLATWPTPRAQEVNQDSWTIANVTAASVGQTFTLSAANAASFGVDWPLWQTSLHQPITTGWHNSLWILGWQTPDLLNAYGQEPGTRYFTAPVPFRSGLRPIITTLDRIELTVEEFFTNPLGSIIRIHPRVYGDGGYVPVPEPASLLMLLCGLIHFSGTSHRLLRRR